MTLNTTGINRYGEKLYRQLSRSSYLGPDACAEAYDMFVRRMRKYRERHPETARVPDAFVKKCERWIAADLLAKKKRRRIAEAAELELAGRETAAPAHGGSTGNTVLFVKLEGFFSHWIGECPRAAEYARVYLLYHAWALSAGRVRLFLPLVPGKKSEFIRDVKRVKKLAAGRAAGLAAERVRTAQYWYARGVRAEVEAGESEGGKRAAALARRRECERRQKDALARLGQVSYRPSLDRLAEIAGRTVPQVRRALSACEREIKAYFA